jgi:hypothetical protein
MHVRWYVLPRLGAACKRGVKWENKYYIGICPQETKRKPILTGRLEGDSEDPTSPPKSSPSPPTAAAMYAPFGSAGLDRRVAYQCGHGEPPADRDDN